MIVDELAGTRILACQGLTAPLALNDVEEKEYCEALNRIRCGHCLSSNQLTTSSLLLLGYRQGFIENLRVRIVPHWAEVELSACSMVLQKCLTTLPALWTAMLCITEKPHVAAKFSPGQLV